MMTEYTFYQIECNGKRYVGHTKDFDERKKDHKYNCSIEKRGNYNFPVYQYIRVNGGWNSCQMSIIEICNLETKQDACMREEYWRIEKDATLNSHRCFMTKEQRLLQYIQCNQKKDKIKLNQYDRARWQLRKDDHNKKSKQKRLQKRLKKQMLLELLNCCCHSIDNATGSN